MQRRVDPRVAAFFAMIAIARTIDMAVTE